jgi:hypothetical protein
MSTILAALPPWVHELPLPVKVAAVAIGLPVLIIALNVLQQLVRSSSFNQADSRSPPKTRPSPPSSSTSSRGLARLPATAWTRTSLCLTAARRCVNTPGIL